MDRSFYSTLELSFSDEAAANNFLRAKFSLDASKARTMHASIDFCKPGTTELVAPLQLTKVNSMVLVQAHPAADLLKFGVEGAHARYLNTFDIFSKQAALQHIFNVLEPLAGDLESQQTLEAIADGNFDSNLINSNAVLLLNLRSDQLDGDFRMNERIFRSQHCTESAKAGATLNQKEKPEQKMVANVQPKKGSSMQGANTIVHKLGAQPDFDPMAFAKSNGAF